MDCFPFLEVLSQGHLAISGAMQEGRGLVFEELIAVHIQAIEVFRLILITDTAAPYTRYNSSEGRDSLDNTVNQSTGSGYVGPGERKPNFYTSDTILNPTNGW
jgi:hypothetical protein